MKEEQKEALNKLKEIVKNTNEEIRLSPGSGKSNTIANIVDGVFITEFLTEIGFTQIPTSGEPQYGKAISNRPKGKQIIYWNNEGYHCDYFGNKLDRNIIFVIEEDGGTRTAFNGCVYNQNDVRNILKLIH